MRTGDEGVALLETAFHILLIPVIIVFGIAGLLTARLFRLMGELDDDTKVFERGLRKDVDDT